MSTVHRALQALCLTAVLAAGVPAAAAADVSAQVPQRIVSLNLCTDQLLVDLVPRERIAAVSFLATDRSLSAAAFSLQGLKQVQGTAEEVLALQPDLVIAGEYTTGPTVDLLKRLGINVLVVPLATDFEGMKETLRTLAKATGSEHRAQDMIAEFEARLASARSLVPARPTAIAYQVNSLASGAGTLLDAALEAAGFRNIARDVKLGPAGRLPLEQLVASPPDLIVLANAADDFKTVLADNLRHPAFQALLEKRPHVHLPMPLWMCATPRIADAVELLASMKQTGVAGLSRTAEHLKAAP